MWENTYSRSVRDWGKWVIMYSVLWKEFLSNPKLTKKGGQGEVHIEGARVNTQGLDILRTQKIYNLCGK